MKTTSKRFRQINGFLFEQTNILEDGELEEIFIHGKRMHIHDGDPADSAREKGNSNSIWKQLGIDEVNV
jgi:hypothetical protein